MRLVLVNFCICMLFVQGCANDDAPRDVCTPVPVQDQDEIIDMYVDQRGQTFQTTASGVRYLIEIPGTGDNIAFGNTIELEYQGVLLDGTDFDNGTIGPEWEFSQNDFIPGFEEALQLFNEGSEGLIIIPGALGYGCFPPFGSVIGDNEVLVFSVKILSVAS